MSLTMIYLYIMSFYYILPHKPSSPLKSDRGEHKGGSLLNYVKYLFCDIQCTIFASINDYVHYVVQLLNITKL